MKTLPPLKRGDTLQLGCLYRNSGGTPEDLSGFTLRSQARSAISGQLVSELATSKANQVSNPGQFSVVAIDTSGWPAEYLLIDIEFRSGSVVTSSETMKVNVLEDVTHD